MNTYTIFRREAWRSREELQEAVARSKRVADEEMPDEIRWLRSYVLEETGGAVGTVCIYQEASQEAIREHAEQADLTADEIVPVTDTVVARPDPEWTSA